MNNNEQLNNLRHSAAHLLAAAVMQIWPEAKRTIGPSIENGFYFDFEFPEGVQVSEKDFARIENKMREIMKSWTGFERHELSKENALKEYENNEYKKELIEEFAGKDETLTFYKSGDYWDLCRGGHCENPKEELKHFKLMSVAGAYWRGDEKNKMLTRIYGIAFNSKEDLENHLHMLEEAEKRDHKKLGRALELFFFDETAPGMTYWQPKGFIVYNTLYDFVREINKKYGYQEVMTPQVNKKELYETSGHWFHYRDDMFISPMSFLREDSKDPYLGSETFGIKPMNCPNAMTIFKQRTRSYHELPMRLAETSMLHRFELSGTLNGLFRARQFRQDDAHVFITEDQIKPEFEQLMKMIDDMYKPFGLTYQLRFGTRSEKFMGEEKDWDVAESVLQKVLDESGQKYFVAEGEAAFYGPKIDILMKDSLGREWQTGTIQLDFQQPKNFGLRYINNEGKEMQPVTFHKAIYGSLERFLGVLIEHYAGAFPLWLSPIQVKIIPIADRHIDFAQEVAEKLKKQNVRVEIDSRAENMKKKIRDAQVEKANFMIVIGDKEVESKSLSVRKRSGENMENVEVDTFAQELQRQIQEKIN